MLPFDPSDPEAAKNFMAEQVTKACVDLGQQLAQSNIPATAQNAIAMVVLGVRMVHLSMADYGIDKPTRDDFLKLLIEAAEEAAEAALKRGGLDSMIEEILARATDKQTVH